MPADAVKPESPPSELNDRSEGFGTFGRIVGYTQKDDGEWPAEVVRLGELPTEHPETSHGDWWRIRNQGDEEINDYQGETYQI